MAPLVQIGHSIHSDDWMRNYVFLLSRVEKVEAYARELEKRIARLETSSATAAWRAVSSEGLP